MLQSYIPREVRAFIIGVRELSNTFDLLSSFFFFLDPLSYFFPVFVFYPLSPSFFLFLHPSFCFLFLLSLLHPPEGA